MLAVRPRPRGVPIPSELAVRRLALARMVSMAGSVSASVALAAVLYARTGSAAWVAAELFISFGTPALASPLTGTLGDRLDRRTVLICSDALGAGVFAVMALVHGPAALLALSFPAALAASPFLPASSAMVPALASPERLPWANARMAIARNAGALAGPALGGGAVSLLGGSAAFALNAASFLASAALIGTLHGDFRARPTPRGEHRAGVTEGLRMLVREPTLRALAVGFLLVDGGNGLAMPAAVALAHVFGTGAVGYGALVALWGVGGLLGGPLAARVLDRRTPVTVLEVSAAGLALAFAVTAVAPWFGLALAALSVGGATMSVVGVAEDLLLARRIPDDLRSRVYAARIAVIQVSIAVPCCSPAFSSTPPARAPSTRRQVGSPRAGRSRWPR